MQAVDTAVASGQVGRTQPWLGAVGARRAEIDLVFRRGPLHSSETTRRRPVHSPHPWDEESRGVVAMGHRQEDLRRMWVEMDLLFVHEVFERELGVMIQKRFYLSLVLGRGDRACRIHQHAARTERGGTSREDRRLEGGEPLE